MVKPPKLHAVMKNGRISLSFAGGGDLKRSKEKLAAAMAVVDHTDDRVPAETKPTKKRTVKAKRKEQAAKVPHRNGRQGR